MNPAPPLTDEMRARAESIVNGMKLEPAEYLGAIKHDQDKAMLELLSPSWIMGVGRVLTFGARKYAAHNWRKGLKRSKVIGAALRHIFDYLRGEDDDPETGESHLYHASCELMFAAELHDTHPELDDRYVPKETLCEPET